MEVGVALRALKNGAFKVLLFFLLVQSGVLTGGLQAVDKAEDISGKHLTLDQAVEYGLEHNRDLTAAREQVQAVQQQVVQSKADFFPSVDSGYSVTHLADQPFASFGGAPLPGGLSKVPSGYETTSFWTISLNQPLFTGFGLLSQYQISKMDLKISEYRLEEVRLNLIRNIRNTFLQVLLTEKLVEVAKDNIERLLVHRRNAEAYYEQGLTPRNDVLKADVALAEAKLNERSVTKKLIVLEAQLNQLLYLPLGMRLDLVDEKAIVRPVPTLEKLYAVSEARRPEYLSISTSVTRAERAVAAAQSRYYPHLYAFGQYYREGDDFFAENNIYRNEHNASIGLRMEWNLFEGGKDLARVREYKYRRRSLEQQRSGLREQIRVQVKDAFEQVQLAEANIETTRVALEQAKENERITALQYKEQLVIFLEVLDARQAVLQAQVDHYQALYGYMLAWADLERAIAGPVPVSGNS